MYLYVVGAVLAVAASAGMAAVQFRRGLIAELRASLDTALKEIALHKGIIARLDQSLKDMEHRHSLTEAENVALKASIEMGTALIPFVQAEFLKFEERVILRHRLLAQHLPDPIRVALNDALAADVDPHGEAKG